MCICFLLSINRSLISVKSTSLPYLNLFESYCLTMRSILLSLPTEIHLNICCNVDLEGLASLARTSKILKPVAEEILYKRELRRKTGPMTAIWAARHGMVATLDKLLYFATDAASVHT